MNSEKFPREPLAAIGLSVTALFLLAGAMGATNHEWPLALSGAGAPVLTYFLFPPNGRIREYGTALIGGFVVVGESFLWSAAGPFVAAAMAVAGVVVLCVALYVVVRKLQV